MSDIIVKNKNWEGVAPRVTVVTPVYNRRDTIGRTIQSLENQTWRDFEYIIVNDGSTENIDDIVGEFMERTELPVMYIKKPNGGVHTARNRGTREARGELMTGLDSDDEFTPDALEKLVATWDAIPEQEKPKYREIVAQCMDEKGNRVGKPFPDNINELPVEEAMSICDATGGEHIGFDVAKIRKENLWPEPQGITYVVLDILWKKLGKMYRSYFINDMVRIYHMETEDSISNTKTRSVQYCKNMQWNCCYMLNDWNIYRGVRNKWLLTMLRYCIFGHVLRFNRMGDAAKLKNISDRVIRGVLWIPSYIGAKIYVKRRM